jgi:acyl-CoA synthetase (AMP-forming)/AMP-acid ligase II
MPTIAQTLRAAAHRTPDREALVFAGRTRTYAQLDREVDAVAAVLAAHGLRKGERVALMAANSDRFVLAFYGALRAGAIVAPVNPAAAAPELAHVLDDSGARVLLADPGAVPTAQDGLELADLATTPLALGGGSRWPDLIALAEGTPGPAPGVAVAEDDDALIMYTSGTTGLPKGALLDHHRSLWVAFNATAVTGLRDGDRLVHVAPLYHAAQLSLMLITGTMLSATHVVLEGFDPGTVLDTLERERISAFFGVPAMYELLLREPSFAARDLPGWRIALFGAAPMPAATVQRLIEALPGVELMQFCGQTEAGPGGIYATFDEVRARPDASGRRPLPNTRVRVVRPDGADVDPGGVGEMLLQGETMMKGYWRNPEATAQTIRDGWLHTGDLARIDADGYITLVDRLKDMIITGGRNVYSVEVEQAIAAHPDVLECAVVGRPHDVYGESIVAVVGLRDGATLELADLRKFCAGRLSSYKLPHALVCAPLPRNASGKVLKRRLRDEVTARADVA